VRRLRAGRLLMSARYRASARETATICCQTMTSPVLRGRLGGLLGDAQCESSESVKPPRSPSSCSRDSQSPISRLREAPALGAGSLEVTIWFVRSAASWRPHRCHGKHAPTRSLWICWTKRTAAIRTDVQNTRSRCWLANGLVDFRSQQSTNWSGLRFAAVSNRQDPARARSRAPGTSGRSRVPERTVTSDHNVLVRVLRVSPMSNVATATPSSDRRCASRRG